jgi:hypothetical protein
MTHAEGEKMASYLAVDAGGSKTEFLLAEEDRGLDRWLTGTIKRVNADEAAAEVWVPGI